MFKGLLLVLIALNSFGQSPPRADSNSAAVAEIKALELKLCSLLVNGKWDEYASHLAEDYVRVLPGGAVETKSEILASFRSSPNRLLDMTPEQMDVRVYGDTALLTIHLKVQSKSELGEVQTRRSLATKTFIHRNNKWYLVSLAGSGPIKQLEVH